MSHLVEAFVCQMCGSCCHGEGGIVVDGDDLVRLAAHLGIAPARCAELYTRAKGEKRVLTSSAEGACVFFREGQGCSVHVAKPSICRAWPFFRGNLLDPLSWELAQEACPGINAEAGHPEFVRQGWTYLQQNGLLKPRRDDTANALVIATQDLPYSL